MADERSEDRMTAARMSVCAIVPTYNRAEYLPDCLSALLAQSRRPDEILVVDDGSTDETAAVVARFAIDGVRYLRQPNQGKAVALNLGLRHTDAEAIWIFDDDDVASRDALALLGGALERSPAAGMAFGDFNRFVTVPADGPPAFMGDFDMDRFPVDQLLQCTVFQPGLLVRRDCYTVVGPFDETLARAQDYDMLLRLSNRFEAVHVSRIVFHQRQHSGARGPAGMRIAGEQIWERQIAFDAVVVRKVREGGDLNAFLPHSARSDVLSRDRQAQALLTSAAVLAKRRLWAMARADIEAAMTLGITAVPDWVDALYAHAFWTEAPRAEAAALLKILRRGSPGPLRKRLLERIGWAYLARTAADIRGGDVRAARRHISGYWQASHGLDLWRHGWKATRRLRGLA